MAASASEDTPLVAPIDGIIGSRTARVGQMVQPGNALMVVVPNDAIYVVANFKGTQLTNLRGGEPAEVTVDAFPSRVLSGQFDSMSPATCLEFSLLPIHNATGNFTKIVQRVPVKIVIDDPADLKDLLRPGMSVEAEIMTTRAIDARTEKSNVFHDCHCCGASFMTWLAVIGGCLGDRV